MKAPEAVFNYSNNYWKNQILRATTPDEKLSVAGFFAGEALEAFIWGADNYSQPKDLAKLLNILDKQASWLCTSSDGVQEGYRLVKGWFRIILAQMVLHGAAEKNDTEQSTQNLRVLWKSKGWLDIEDCLEPQHDALRTIQVVKYPKGEKDGTTIFGLIKIILEPTGEFPVGARYKTKAGSEWEVQEVNEKSVLLQCETAPYYVKSFSKIMVRDWQRIL